MTSKALEAAAQALWDFARPDSRPRLITDLDANHKEIVLDRTADIIRAFGKNLSEEAAEAAATAMWSEMTRSDLKVSPRLDPAIAAVQAAIEKDLE